MELCLVSFRFAFVAFMLSVKLVDSVGHLADYYN